MKKIVLLVLAFSLIGCTSEHFKTNDHSPNDFFCEHEFVRTNEEIRENCTSPSEEMYICKICGFSDYGYGKGPIAHTLNYLKTYVYFNNSYVIEAECTSCSHKELISIFEDDAKVESFDSSGNVNRLRLKIDINGITYDAIKTIKYNDNNIKISEEIDYPKRYYSFKYENLISNSFEYENNCLREIKTVLTLDDSSNFKYNIKTTFEENVEENTTMETAYIVTDENECRPCYQIIRKTNEEKNTVSEILNRCSNDTETWLKKSTQKVQYDEKGNLIYFETLDYSLTSDDYYGEKHYFKYNDERLLFDEIYITSMDNENFLEKKRIINYDIDGDPIDETTFRFNTVTQTWDEFEKYIYEYKFGHEYEKILLYSKSERGDFWIVGSKTDEFYSEENFCKSRKEYVWSLEENQWILEYEDATQEDGEGNVILREYAQIFQPNNQKYGFRFINEFDSNGKKVGSLILSWSKEENDWVNYSKLLYTYDSSNNLSENVRYNWCDEKNDWEIYSKFITGQKDDANYYESYVFSKEENKWIGIEKSIYSSKNERFLWSFEEDCWMPEPKCEQIEDGGNFQGNIYYEWSNVANDWIYSRKVETIDLEFGKETLYYVWSKENSNWVKNAREIYQELPDGFTSYETYDWSNKKQCWIGKEKSIYFYDEETGLRSNESYAWNNELNDWTKQCKYFYVYSLSGINVFDFYDWDENYQEWIKANKNVNYIDVITPDGGNLYIEEFYDWSDETNGWVPNKKTSILNEEEPLKSTIISYVWSNETNSWIPIEKYEYSYDYIASFDKLTGYYVWSNETNSWVLTDF